jgi:hypothetical protein
MIKQTAQDIFENKLIDESIIPIVLAVLAIFIVYRLIIVFQALGVTQFKKTYISPLFKD